MKRHLFLPAVLLVCFLQVFSFAGETKILTNHLGYEPAGPKHAVVLGKAGDSISECSLKNDVNDQHLIAVPWRGTGPVQKWKRLVLLDARF
jgi:hypothetical protein